MGVEVVRVEWESGRERGLGPEGMGQIRGICRQHMPALPLCENPSAARGRESAFIGHLRPAPSRGMGASSAQRQRLVNSAVWETRSGSPTLLLCNSACGGGDQGTAFNEIPLIVLPQALVSHFIQNSALLVQTALVSNCFHLSFLMLCLESFALIPTSWQSSKTQQT